MRKIWFVKHFQETLGRSFREYLISFAVTLLQRIREKLLPFLSAEYVAYTFCFPMEELGNKDVNQVWRTRFKWAALAKAWTMSFETENHPLCHSGCYTCRCEFHSFARKIGDSSFRSVLWAGAFLERFTFHWEVRGTDYAVRYKGAYTRARSFSLPSFFSLFFRNSSRWKEFVTCIDLLLIKGK